MKIKAVLFDMIGTTVLEKDPDLIINCLKLALEESGVIHDREIIEANRGKDKMKMINIILQSGNHPNANAEAIFESFKRNVDESIDNFAPANNVDQVFISLRELGIQIGLGSGMPREQFKGILDHVGWKETDFQYIGISSEIGKARPDPAMILDMMKSLDLTDKSEFIKVGDTVADIEEGKNAGVKTVGVLSGTQARDQIAKANPNFLIDKIDEVVEIIKTLK